MKFTVCPSQFVFPLSFLVVHLIATTGSLDRTLIDASFFGAGPGITEPQYIPSWEGVMA